jgi:F420H(2)-dependent biliverdin reductase
VAHDPHTLGPEVQAFLAERHLGTLTVLRPDGSPHVSPVGFSFDPAAGLVRIITFAGARKVAHLRSALAAATGGVATPRAAVCQLDGARWLTLEGAASVTDAPDAVADAVAGYAARYRQPGERTDRVAIEIAVDRILGRA